MIFNHGRGGVVRALTVVPGTRVIPEFRLILVRPRLAIRRGAHTKTGISHTRFSSTGPYCMNAATMRLGSAVAATA